jgi:hypothetical protein
MSDAAEVVVLMQNPWSRWYSRLQAFDEPEPESMRLKVWARVDWLQATRNCVSGRVLQRLFPPAPDPDHGPLWPPPGVWLDDTTLEVADRPSGIRPPDAAYVRRLLDAKRPRLVVAMGRQAGNLAAVEWAGPLVILVHPAARRVPRDYWEAAARLVARRAGVGRVELANLGAGKARLLALDPAGDAPLFAEGS